MCFWSCGETQKKASKVPALPPAGCTALWRQCPAELVLPAPAAQRGPPQCLPLLSTHTVLQWQGPHVCLSCQHTQLYSDKAPTMSASPVNTHSGTVARPPQCLPLLSTHSGTVASSIRDQTEERPPDDSPPWRQSTLLKDYLSLPWWGTILTKDHPDEILPKFNLVRDQPDKRPPLRTTTLMKDYLSLPWWGTILTKDHTDERPPWWVYPDERLPEFTLVMDHPDERPHWRETTLINDHQWKTALN